MNMEKIIKDEVLAELEKISTRFGVDIKEIKILKILIKESKDEKENENIIFETAVSHDPFMNR